MLKVFLVEDEYVMREGIKNNIDWSSNGYEFCGEASDGELAFPMIQRLKPDIVILQGKNHITFWDKLEWEVIGTPQSTNIQCEKGTRSYNQGLYCAKLNEHKFYLIDSYHPTSHGIWANEKVFCAFNDILQKARSEYANEKASL